MSRAAEFKDSETDRTAVAAILTAAGREHAPGDDLDLMNAEWDRLAVGLVRAPEKDFDGWEARLSVLTAGSPEVHARVEELVSHLIGWRLGDV